MTLEQRLLSAWTGRGVLARTLLPLSLVYRALLDLDRARQHRKRLAREATSTPLRAPVVVIGNLVAGGAGKTPTVIATTRLLREHGFTPGIVSRGHGRSDPDTMLEVTANSDPRQAGDEPLLLRLRTQAPLVVGRDRNAACAELLRLHPEVDVIVSDDGLQHHALRPDVAVIVFDDRGAGNGWLLPAGPLREPMPSRLSACQLVIYNADRPSTSLPGFMATRGLTGAVSLQAWWSGEGASRDTLEALRGRTVIAAAGMAQPTRFFSMLRSAGLAIAELPLADHFGYATLPWPATAADVVVTEKDAVKLRPEAMGATRVWVAPLDFQPEPAYGFALLQLLRTPARGPDKE